MTEDKIKKLLITVSAIMSIFTLVTMCAIGTWSAWYPWPPPKSGTMNDFQTAVIITWFWAVLAPTAIVDLFVSFYGNQNNWWE